jgi:hypothetical protein
MSASVFTWSLTAFVIISITVFDIWIIVKKGKRASISASIINGAKKMPLVVFIAGLGIGVVTGHLLWSMSSFDHLPIDELTQKCEQFLQEVKK